MAQKIVAGNWKMNTLPAEAQALTSEVVNMVKDERTDDTLVILAPPFVHLSKVLSLVGDTQGMAVAAQNCHFEKSGAFTGEVSPAMLADMGVKFVILGHSERREYFGEDGALLVKKVDAVLAHGMRPIFCCGEKLETREANLHKDLVATQVKEALFHLSPAQMAEVVIAYEPVWAIGTGVTASAEQAEEMHEYIRGLLKSKYRDLADEITIQYGGSMKPGNAKELLAQPNVDGGLIGGASLKARDFVDIVKSY